MMRMRARDHTMTGRRSIGIIALVTALSLQPAGAGDAPPPAFKFVPHKLSKSEIPTIAALYARTCAACHGRSGEGARNGLSLYGSKDPRQNAVPIHFGRSQPPPLTIVMPAYGAEGMLSQVEIAKLAEYIALFKPPWP